MRLEKRDVKRIILVGVHPEILDLVQRDRLILGLRLVWRLITLRICAKSSNLYLPRGAGTNWIYHYGQKWFGILLIQHLSRTVDPGHPATVPRMAVVPSFSKT